MFSEIAHAMRYPGEVKLSLIAGADGSVSHLQLVQPAGLGIDERALAAVQAYRFSPATQNGQPVSAEIYLDFNFQIF